MLAGMLYDYERADLLNEEALTRPPEDDPSLAGLALPCSAFAAEARGETDRATRAFDGRSRSPGTSSFLAHGLAAC